MADNRTSDGRDRNRRVEVFVKTGVLTSPTPPTTSIWDFSKLTPPQEPIIRTRPDRIFQPIPSGPKGQSLEAWLDERLSSISSRWLRRKIRNAVLKRCLRFARGLGHSGRWSAQGKGQGRAPQAMLGGCKKTEISRQPQLPPLSDKISTAVQAPPGG